MKIERTTLQALRAAAIADDSTTLVRSSVLIALLDVAEAVQDAPVATVEWQRDVGMVLGSCRLSSGLIGQRVRLVRVGDGDACIGGGEG